MKTLLIILTLCLLRVACFAQADPDPVLQPADLAGKWAMLYMVMDDGKEFSMKQTEADAAQMKAKNQMEFYANGTVKIGGESIYPFAIRHTNLLYIKLDGINYKTYLVEMAGGFMVLYPVGGPDLNYEFFKREWGIRYQRLP